MTKLLLLIDQWRRLTSFVGSMKISLRAILMPWLLILLMAVMISLLYNSFAMAVFPPGIFLQLHSGRLTCTSVTEYEKLLEGVYCTYLALSGGSDYNAVLVLPSAYEDS